MMPRRAFLFVLSWWLAAGALAASISLHPNGNLVVLEGRIDIGDFDKVERLARDASPTAIYLASPGGNLAEALRIGALVRRLAWETRSAEAKSLPPAMRISVAKAYGVRDPANNVCTSACFFIFASGIYRDGHAIGIHRPFMLPADIERLPADDASRMNSNVRSVVEAFLRRMGVPPKYVDEMYEVPREQIRWLTDEEIDADFHGFVPQVREWVRGQCGDEAETLRCKESVMTGIRIRALEQNGR